MNMHIRAYRQNDEESLVKLWKECGLVVSWNNPRVDIERKVKENVEELLIGMIDDMVIASAIVGYDGHRGWIYYLAVHPKYQKKGLGDQIMQFSEKHLLKRGCPKINIMVRESNLDVIKFYKSIGYKEDNVVTLSKRLIPDQ